MKKYRVFSYGKLEMTKAELEVIEKLLCKLRIHLVQEPLNYRIFDHNFSLSTEELAIINNSLKVVYPISVEDI